MIIEYRWVVIIGAGLIFVLAGYVFDLGPRQAELATLHQSEIMLHEKLAAMKALPGRGSALKHNNQINGVNALADFIQSNGLNINKIKQENNVLHVDLRGDYPQFIAMMSGLLEKTDVISLKTISCQWEKEYLQLGMNLLLMGKVDFLKHEVLRDQMNPFCTSENRQSFMNEDELLVSPISQIKMAGLLQFGERRVAILQMPDKMTVMVGVGDLIGLEKARVVGIDHDYVLARLDTGRELRVA